MGDRAFDFSRVPGPGAQEIKDNNGEGILHYSFRGQTPQYLDSIRNAGLASVWIWERNTDSIFNGYDYAVNECRLHEANAKPGELTYVACDTNDGGVAGRQLAPFLQGWSDTTREPTFGVYGSSGAIRQAQAFGGKCQRYWGVVNWINGGAPNNDPRNIAYWRGAGAHLIQLIGSPIAGTDENLILRPDWATIGGFVLPDLSFLLEEDDDVTQYITLENAPVGSDESGAWEKSGNTKRHVLIDEWNQAKFFAFVGKKPEPQALPVSQRTWDSIPTVT